MVPPEVDLRGLEYMPLLGAKLFSSDFNLEASDAEFRRGLMLWWAAWNQQPAASLPNSERAQAKLAGFEDEKSPTWRKVKARALHGFVLCSDGRLYHPIVAEQALIAWEKRLEDGTKRENENERQRRLREDRRRMFQQLRAVGIVPRYDIGTSELRALVAQHVTVTAASPPNAPVTVTSTAKTGRDETRQEIPIPARAATSTGVARASEPDTEGHEPTPAGQVCRAMRAKGLQAVNPGDPRLLELLRQGATVPEFEGLAEEAAKRGKGFAWVLATLTGRRAEAAAIALAPPAPAPAREPRAATPDADQTARMLAEQAAKPAAAAPAGLHELRQRIATTRSAS
jgi:hypothetical protein